MKKFRKYFKRRKHEQLSRRSVNSQIKRILRSVYKHPEKYGCESDEGKCCKLIV